MCQCNCPSCDYCEEYDEIETSESILEIDPIAISRKWLESELQRKKQEYANIDKRFQQLQGEKERCEWDLEALRNALKYHAVENSIERKRG
jgi:flagellar motility protein MotE (MotC chaperone)